jgi:hypothetical protein
MLGTEMPPLSPRGLTFRKDYQETKQVSNKYVGCVERAVEYTQSRPGDPCAKKNLWY